MNTFDTICSRKSVRSYAGETIYEYIPRDIPADRIAKTVIE